MTDSLKKILCLTVCLLSLGTAWAQGESLPDQLLRLEQKHGINAQPGQAIVERLQALELKTSGNTYSGSIFERINRLSQFAPSATGSATSKAMTTTMTASVSPEKRERIMALLHTANLGKNAITANTFPSHFFRIEPPETVVTEDYLDSVMAASKNRVFKFEKMPIPVYITAPPDPAYANAVMAAFGDWDRRSNGLIKFTPVTQASAARIKVTWNHLGSKTDKNENTLGAHTMTKWTKKPSGRLSLLSVGAIPVPLYIPSPGPKYTVPPQEIEVNLDLVESNDAEVRYLTLRNIVAHELGHAVGLLGHSPVKGDLMFPTTDEHSRISQRDLNTIKRLYEKKTTVPL